MGSTSLRPYPFTYANGVVINDNDGPPNGTPASHHIWVINNLIHGYGQGGVGTDEADWIFVLHNVVYDNASVTCDAQGSGIGLVVAKHTPNYTPRPQTTRPGRRSIKWSPRITCIITC